MAPASHHLKIKLQIYCGAEIAMGPGKADLLDAITRMGSISAAARALGMSYRRAWLLVDAMNRCWREPLVSATPGAGARGGARVTPLGAAVLGDYRALQRSAGSAAHDPAWSTLDRALLAAPKGKQNEPV